MKILIATHYFLPHKGGIEFVAYNQAKELVKQGHEVTVVSSKIGDEPEEEIIDGINVRRVKAWNWFENKWGVPYPIFSPKLFSLLNKEAKDADIVHVHDLFYLSAFGGAVASQINKKPLILMEHVELVKTKRWFVNWIQRLVYWTYGGYIRRKANKILVCNKKVSNWINKPNKIVFLHNAVDTNLFKPILKKKKIELRKKYNLHLDKPIIIFVGRLVEKKGFEKLFEAKDKDYFILFVGSGDIPKHMKKDKDTRFLPFLPQKELAELYQLSDIFCLPSVNEGFPLTILEAMACGLPIITSNNEGYSDYINKNFVKLINPSIKEIKKSIKELLNSPKNVKKMAEYSRKESLRKFDWKVNANKLLSVYRDAIKENESQKDKKTK